MASIRKRGNSYLLVVSMGYDPEGHRRKPQQKTVHPPEGLTPKAKEKWLEEEAALFERQCKNQPLTVDKSRGQVHHLGGVHRLLAGPHRPRQAGEVHPGQGQAGHGPVPASPGQLQTYRTKA